MTIMNDGGPAFPFGQISEMTGKPVNGFYDPGMSLRDYFAAKELTMCMTADESAKTVAEMAYSMADAMLKAREVRP